MDRRPEGYCRRFTRTVSNPGIATQIGWRLIVVGLRGTGEVADRDLSANLRRSGIGGVGGGANRRHIFGRDLATAIVDEPDVHRTVGLARPSFASRTIGPGKVGVAPLLERPQRDVKLLTGGSERVRIPGASARLLVGRPAHHPVLDQCGEPVGEDIRGDAQRITELREPGHAVHGFAQDQEGPPLAEHTPAAGDRTVRIEHFRTRHGSTAAELPFPIQMATLEAPTQHSHPWRTS
jgi:hypothetical protein